MKTILTFILILFAYPSFAEPEFGEIHFTDGGRQADGTQLFGIEIELEDGWHTYWRLAGQNGLDPVFDFEGSENIGSYEFHWPEPRLVGEKGIEAVGYYNSVSIVVSMTPKDIKQPIKLSLNMDIGVCETQCVLVNREFENELNSGYSIDGIGLQQLLGDAYNDRNTCDFRNITFPIGDFVLIEGQNEHSLFDSKMIHSQGGVKIPEQLLRAYLVTPTHMKSICD